jgi:amidophosphoribosyltransferase
MGLVQAGFTPRDLAALPGDRAIGHVRYSTAGGSHIKNAQPFAVDYARGSIALAHNGNLTNYEAVRERLEARGSIFQSTSDTEVIVHLIAMSTHMAVEDRISDALGHVEGAYSILFLTERELVAARDPYGFRPLCLGALAHRGTGSRTCSRASRRLRADRRAVRPRSRAGRGASSTSDEGLKSTLPLPARPAKPCIFEYVYFARPDSQLNGASVYEVRKALGRRLAEEQPLHGATSDDTVVIPVPDSGVPAAVGFARASGLPFEMGLIRSHYVGRTFIEPQQSIRHFGVRLKLSPNRAVIEGKRVVIVDDSIVRGTTSRKIVKMIRDAGAREVHVRISSPPTRWPCYYGIDTPTQAELIAANCTIEQTREYLAADSLGYLTLEGLAGAVSETRVQGEAAGPREPGGVALPRVLLRGLRCAAVDPKDALAAAAARDRAVKERSRPW